MQMLELFALVCLAAAWSVPNHYFPWTSFYNDSAAGAALMLLAISQLRRLFASPYPRVAWVVVAVAFIPAIQWLVGILHFSGDVWVSVLYVGALALAIAVGHAWAGAGAAIAARRLAWTMLLGGLLASVIAVLQGLDMAQLGIWAVEGPPLGRPGANLAQPNNLATLLGVSCVCLWLLYEQRRLSGAASCALFAFLFAALAMTQSRTSLLFGPIALIGWAILRRRVPLRASAVAMTAATATYWVMAWGWPKVQAALLLRGADSIASRGVESPRLKMWGLLLDAVSQRPWSGYGWLQVGAAQLQVADRHPQMGEMWLQAHDLFLDLVVWCGYPIGLLLSAMILGWFASRTLRVRSLEGGIAMLAVAVVGTHALLELPHHYLYFLVPTGLWIGVAERESGALTALPTYFNWIPAALVIGIAAMVWRDYEAVEDDFRLIRFESLRIGSVRATQPAPDAPALSALTAFLRVSRTSPRAGMSPAELADFEAVARRFPYAPSISRYAMALALNGRLADATVLYESIRRIHGEKTYRGQREELRGRVEGGEVGLAELDRALPN